MRIVFFEDTNIFLVPYLLKNTVLSFLCIVKSSQMICVCNFGIIVLTRHRSLEYIRTDYSRTTARTESMYARNHT